MIIGRSGASGKYSSKGRTFYGGRQQVIVSNMPDDPYSVRIAFRHMEETTLPIMKLDNRQAEALWAALSDMAVDLDWKDMERK